MSDRVYRLGCDIGGTFTDFVLLNDQTGEIRINKCLTTHGNWKGNPPGLYDSWMR